MICFVGKIWSQFVSLKYVIEYVLVLYKSLLEGGDENMINLLEGKKKREEQRRKHKNLCTYYNYMCNTENIFKDNVDWKQKVAKTFAENTLLLD